MAHKTQQECIEQIQKKKNWLTLVYQILIVKKKIWLYNFQAKKQQALLILPTHVCFMEKRANMTHTHTHTNTDSNDNICQLWFFLFFFRFLFAFKHISFHFSLFIIHKISIPIKQKVCFIVEPKTNKQTKNKTVKIRQILPFYFSTVNFFLFISFSRLLSGLKFNDENDGKITSYKHNDTHAHTSHQKQDIAIFYTSH